MPLPLLRGALSKYLSSEDVSWSVSLSCDVDFDSSWVLQYSFPIVPTPVIYKFGHDTQRGSISDCTFHVPWEWRYSSSSDGRGVLQQRAWGTQCGVTPIGSMVVPSDDDGSIQLFCYWQGPLLVVVRILVVGPTALLLGYSCPVLMAWNSEWTRWQPDSSKNSSFSPCCFNDCPCQWVEPGVEMSAFLSAGSAWQSMTEVWPGPCMSGSHGGPLPTLLITGLWIQVLGKGLWEPCVSLDTTGPVPHVANYISWVSESKCVGLLVFRGNTSNLLAPTPYRAGHPAG